MDTLLIIQKDGETLEFNLGTGVFTIGAGNENDLILPLESTTLSFLTKEKSFLAKINGDGKKASGEWGKELKDKTILSFGDYTIVYLPGVKLRRDKIKDWIPEHIPQDPKKSSYPADLLNFLLEIMAADQGSILLLEKGQLTTLATKKIQLRDQAEVFLQRILDSRPGESVINMNYNTHTLLFQAGLTPLDFCIIQHELSETEKIVLYLPRTASMNEIPEGMMLTVLNLCAGNLVSHLMFKKYKASLKVKNLIEHDFFWGHSEKMLSLKQYVDKLSKTNLSVLVTGETGTGKEMLVKYLKEKSGKANIVSVNCAAIPKDLAESVLFGHKKGSFTGAVSDQKGKIEEAGQGILFLDEIGELDLHIQAKLLRVIQEGTLTPVGGTEVKVNFWLVTATHRNLEEMIKTGQFREDLYFRINEASLKMPSLSERNGDIPALAAHFLEDVIKRNGLSTKILSPEVMTFLEKKEWKGNIRELRAFIRKIVLLSDTKVIGLDTLSGVEALSSAGVSKSFPDDLQAAKHIFVESHIEKILERCHGNKTHAAKVLGITTRNLYRLLTEKPEGFDIPE